MEWLSYFSQISIFSHFSYIRELQFWLRGLKWECLVLATINNAFSLWDVEMRPPCLFCSSQCHVIHLNDGQQLDIWGISQVTSFLLLTAVLLTCLVTVLIICHCVRVPGMRNLLRRSLFCIQSIMGTWEIDQFLSATMRMWHCLLAGQENWKQVSCNHKGSVPNNHSPQLGSTAF